jgi:hypothetical protein
VDWQRRPFWAQIQIFCAPEDIQQNYTEDAPIRRSGRSRGREGSTFRYGLLAAGLAF